MKDEIEVMYAQYEGLIVKLATGNQNLFVDVLGKEDAIQEAGLAFVIAYRQYEEYGEAVLGNEKSLAGYFKSIIQFRLTSAVRHEMAYRKRQPEYLADCFDEMTPDRDCDVDYIVAHHEQLSRDAFRLKLIRTLLQHPQLLVDKAGLTVRESLIIWKLFVDGLSLRSAAAKLGLHLTQLCRLRDKAFEKMRKYVIHNT